MSIDMSVWSGRIDTDEGSQAKRWHQQVKPLIPDLPASIALIGFACDEGVRRNQGRQGAAAGPVAIRKALANLAWHPGQPLVDAGDIFCSDGDLTTAHQCLSQRVQYLIKQGHFPLVLGGGHETAYGTWCGLAAAYPDSTIGIVNFDAHFDLREAEQATSGTPFAQIARDCAQAKRPFHYLCLGVAESSNTQILFARAKLLNVKWVLDIDMSLEYLPGIRRDMLSFIQQVDLVYLTIDLDVLPAAVMPAVSAPAALGVELHVVDNLVRTLVASGKLAAADLVEFNPLYDIDSHGAKTAARLVWNITRYL